MADLRLERVSKRFGNALAVNDLTLDIADGELLVLVGPSGCGKSTTLRLVAGLEELSEGAIYIGGRLVNDLPPGERAVALVASSGALYPHMSVYGNLAFGLKLRHRPSGEIVERVQRTALTLGLGALLQRKPPQLSGGECQRVALARAAVRTPQVALIDELPSHLDGPLRVQARTEILGLHQRLQTAVLYVTHDQAEALSMGTRLAVLSDGLLQQVATPAEIYDHPANLFVAGFIGSPAMNVFRAELRTAGGMLYATTDTFTVMLPGEKRAALAHYQKRAVILGVRPEDLYEPATRKEGADSSALLPVEVVERSGGATYAYLLAGHTAVVARLDARTSATAGRPLEIAIDASHVHVFDPDTEQALRA